MEIPRDLMYLKFRLYGFLKNLRFFDPFIVLFFIDAGLSFFSIGLLYAIREIGNNLLEIPTGFIADSLGRRKAMLLSFSSYIGSFIIFFLFSNFWLFAIAMVLFASGEAFRSGTHKAMILDYLKRRKLEKFKVEYYGRTRSASQLGSALSSLAAIPVVFYLGDYRFVFLAAIIPYIGALFLMASYPKYLDGIVNNPNHSMGDAFRETWGSFVKIFKNRDSVRGILNSSLFGGIFKASKEYLQPVLEAQAIALPLLLYLADEERIAIVVGLVYFVLFLLSAITSRSAGRLAGRFRELATPINLTFILGGVLLIAAGLCVNYILLPMAILAFIGLYILQNIRKPLNVGYISDTIDSRVMASGLSVEAQIVTIVTAVFAPAVGWMADYYGIGIALAIAGVAYIAFLPLAAVRKCQLE